MSSRHRHPVASTAVTEPFRTRVYLVRHCDVHNPSGVLYGHLSGFRLSTKGVRQAEAIGTYLSRSPARRIYTSPLERARESADVIASRLPGIPVVATDDLTEARFGRYLQGVRPRDVPWRRPQWFVHMVWPGLLKHDESVQQMAQRVRRPVLQLLREFPGAGGICVSHGDPIQAFWVEADGRPAHALHRLQCAKGGLLELDFAGETLTNLTYRSPAFLSEAAAQTGVRSRSAS
ncbi:MAG: histidine phosphatase family protein [Chloroflexi bacterium]|nr:MAG: histidine phosphatase family protein [Chloroflexota bacterium]